MSELNKKMNDPNEDSHSRGGAAPFCFPKRGVSRVAARHQGVLHGGRRTGRHLGIASSLHFGNGFRHGGTKQPMQSRLCYGKQLHRIASLLPDLRLFPN